jgi:hypothetical protein
MHFLFKMVCNNEILYCHFFYTPLYNSQLGGSKHIRRDLNKIEDISVGMYF